ncbi:MAG: hypothetical protein AAB436_04560 [Patescibacteria group bacterium]
MSTELEKLKKPKPTKFPSRNRDSKSGVYIESTKGKTTKEIIAEMERLSKKDIYVAE